MQVVIIILIVIILSIFMIKFLPPPADCDPEYMARKRKEKGDCGIIEKLECDLENVRAKNKKLRELIEQLKPLPTDKFELYRETMREIEALKGEAVSK